MLLVHAVINDGDVLIRRVRVEGLTLQVVVVRCLVVILSRNERCHADVVLLVGLELLQALKLVRDGRGVVIDVRQVRRVVADTLVLPHEGVLMDELGHGALPQHVRADGDVRDHKLVVLVHALVLTVRLEGAA